MPMARSGHTFCTLGTKHILFGGTGRGESGGAVCLNDLYLFEPSSEEAKVKVKRLTPGGTPPHPGPSTSRSP